MIVHLRLVFPFCILPFFLKISSYYITQLEFIYLFIYLFWGHCCADSVTMAALQRLN